jgi:phosphatidylglycerol:prolipoprotein diacylglycerol transferase
MFAVIPYFTIDPIHLGPLTIQPFGLLVATGVFVGAAVARKAIQRRGLDEDHYQRMITWMLLFAFGLAHIVAVTAYHPERLLDEPLRLVKFWDGLSSVGGFFGAVIGCMIYARRAGVKFIDYADAIMEGFVFGWFFGRMGCTVVHDHPGIASDFFLAIDYPAGHPSLPAGPHLDLGLLELLFTVVIILVFLWLKRRPRFPGFYVALGTLMYAPVRFYLDFLRKPAELGGDDRYVGLTPAQWSVVALVFMGAYVLWKNKDREPLVASPVLDDPKEHRPKAQPAKATRKPAKR